MNDMAGFSIKCSVTYCDCKPIIKFSGEYTFCKFHTIIDAMYNTLKRFEERHPKLERNEEMINKACEALYGLADDLGCDIMDIEKAKEYVRKRMEE